MTATHLDATVERLTRIERGELERLAVLHLQHQQWITSLAQWDGTERNVPEEELRSRLGAMDTAEIARFLAPEVLVAEALVLPRAVDEREFGARVKQGIIGTIRGTGEVTEAAVGTVSNLIQHAVTDASRSGGAVAGLGVAAVRGAIQAVGEVVGLGAETAATTLQRTVDSSMQVAASVGNAARGAVIGSVRGTSEAGVESLEAISRTSRSAVKEAAVVGTDLTTAAVGAVEGAIEAVKDTTVSAEEAAAAAATGAVEAAAEVGEAAAVRVRHAVEGTMSGVRVVVRSALGREPVRSGEPAASNVEEQAGS